ncbi:MAG: NAD(P)/FAD-dependent oxidoreductase [Leptospira sp.]|nr:NAD(P)/FAD-dependent oxidoreductase [Leptospira sp.]
MNISRKEFLKSATAVAGILSAQKIFSQNPRPNRPANPGSSPKTAIVLGGGLSGLYSAYLLNKTGIKVTVIEANKRMGGRIFSFSDADSNVTSELGGEWISDSHRNIKSVIRELDLKTIAHNVKPEFSIGTGNKSNPAGELSEKSKNLLQKVSGLYRNMGATQKRGLDKLDLFGYLRYQGIEKNDLELMNLRFSGYYGENISHVSASRALSDIPDLENSYSIRNRISGGSSALILALQEKLKDSEIISGDPVTEISQDQLSVTVKTLQARIITADICICAIPANVISDISWTPELPKEKKLSALQLGYSRISKLSFNVSSETTGLKNFQITGNSPVRFLYPASDLNSGQQTISATAIGDLSEIFAGSGADEKKAFLEECIARVGMSANAQISGITGIAWQDEPYIRGGIALFSPGSFDIQSNLRKPFNRVFFAGEHLASQPGSMEAAITSAIEAVNSI